MADIPRDPRQLARDILAGRVRIEDLARERQMRGGGLPTPALRQPQARVPAPRQVAVQPQARQVPVQPPVQRAPVRPVQRVIQVRPLQQPQRPVQRPVAVPVVRQPQRAPLQVTVAPPQLVEPTMAPAPEPVAVAKVVRRPTRIQELVRSKLALRQGIVLAEVLGKPVALRDQM